MQLIEDLKKVNTLDDKQFADFLLIINSNELFSFKDQSDFEAFCNSNKIEFDDAKIIVRVFYFIVDLVFKKRDFATALTHFEDTYIKPSKDDPDVLRAWTRLKDKISNLSSFYIFRKRYKLRTLMPNLDEFDIICDARPIYDSTKTIVDYLFPMILRIGTDEDKDLSCEFDEEQLSAMETEIEYAKLKISKLKAAFKGNLHKRDSSE
jgi:hypothetical protein